MIRWVVDYIVDIGGQALLWVGVALRPWDIIWVIPRLIDIDL